MKRLLLSLILVLGLGCVNKTETSSLSVPPELIPPSDLDQIPLRWSQSAVPLALKISSSFSAQEKTLLESMETEWNQAGALSNFFAAPSAAVPDKNYATMGAYYDNEFGIYKVASWYPEIGNTALAVTQFYAARRNIGTASEYLEIVHADILVNSSNFTFGTAFEANKYDLPSVILHELGHVLGLRHESTTSSIMYPYLGTGTIHRLVNDFDKTTLQDLYGTRESSAFTVSREALETEPSEEGTIVRGIVEILPNHEERIWFETKSTKSLPHLKMKHNH